MQNQKTQGYVNAQFAEENIKQEKIYKQQKPWFSIMKRKKGKEFYFSETDLLLPLPTKIANKRVLRWKQIGKFRDTTGKISFDDDATAPFVPIFSKTNYTAKGFIDSIFNLFPKKRTFKNNKSR